MEEKYGTVGNKIALTFQFKIYTINYYNNQQMFWLLGTFKPLHGYVEGPII